MAYLDEALKLDLRALMATAMKSGKKTSYSIEIRAPGGRVICRDLRDAPDRVATAAITVIWRERPDQTVTGAILLRYRGWDERAAEQRIAFTGRPKSVVTFGASSVPIRDKRSRRCICRRTGTAFNRARRAS